MSRTLTAQRFVVPRAQRKKHIERMRARRAYYLGAGCRFWVFEEIDLTGAFMEFIEAGDAATLKAALANAPERFNDPARIYQEMELE